MSRPDDLDRAEARVAAARARLTESTTALQTQLQPRAIATALKSHAQERQRALLAGAAGVVSVVGVAAFAARLLRRRREAKLADPPAHAKRVVPAPQPPALPRVRRTFKRIKP